MDDDAELGLGCIVGSLLLVFISTVAVQALMDLNEEPTQEVTQEVTQEAPESPQIDENLIEGVVVRLIPGPHDVTTVVFEDAQYDLKLGDHKIYVGEWNQLRVTNGFVHESYLGEGTIQEMVR
jgi:hypothetical protein